MIKNIINRIKYIGTGFKTSLSLDNRGMGSIEMVLLILVILGIIIIFRDYIESLINTVFTKIDNQISAF